jgi:enoyl-CoA hydratase/carnithine racemase
MPRLNFDEQAATLTLNRNEVRNELTGTHLVDDICNTVEWINATPEVRVLVITGAGRAFSAGGNIKDIRDKKGIFAGSPALTFSGRIIDADEALQLGLLLEIVEPEALLARAGELAAGFAGKPPQALRMTKRLMRAAQRLELGDLLDVSASYQANCHHTEDHQRAMDAMLDKTETVFEGN